MEIEKILNLASDKRGYFKVNIHKVVSDVLKFKENQKVKIVTDGKKIIITKED